MISLSRGGECIVITLCSELNRLRSKDKQEISRSKEGKAGHSRHGDSLPGSLQREEDSKICVSSLGQAEVRSRHGLMSAGPCSPCYVCKDRWVPPDHPIEEIRERHEWI